MIYSKKQKDAITKIKELMVEAGIPEAKWSDDSQFVPQSHLSNSDNIMGLSDGANVKYNLNISKNSQYVSLTGVDSSTNGSELYPLATISYGNSLITDASPTNVYTQIINNNITDNGAINFSPNINVSGISPNTTIINGSDIGADVAWLGIFNDSSCFWSNLKITNNFNLDFSSTSYFPNMFIQFSEVNVGGNFYFNGNGTGNIFINTYQCTFNGIVSLDNVNNYTLFSNGSSYLGQLIVGTNTFTSIQFISLSDFFNSSLEFNANIHNAGVSAQIVGGYIKDQNITVSSNNISAGAFVKFISCHFGTNSTITMSADSTMVASSSVYLLGGSPVNNFIFDDQSVSGNTLFLEVSRESYPNSIQVLNGIPHVNFESNLRKIVNGSSQALQPNQTYLLQNSGVTTLSFDTFFQPMDSVRIIMAHGSGGFTIPMTGTGLKIVQGILATTSIGSLNSASGNNCVEFVFNSSTEISVFSSSTTLTFS